MPDKWTEGVPLPGGDFPVDGVDNLLADIRKRYPFLDEKWAKRLLRAYGTDVFEMMGDATSPNSLGQHFGWNLYAREVDWLRNREFAKTADDILWRRSKIGLRLTEEQIKTLSEYFAS
ncbi:MAG TPA: hypothetical protein ENK34_00185 [Rhodobacteraceae bacterium]|nr:hypothetical protein [Paracoccaceae bacterium]